MWQPRKCMACGETFQPFNGKEVYGVTFTASMDKSSSKPVPPYKSVMSFIANANLTCGLMNASPLKALPPEVHSDATQAK